MKFKISTNFLLRPYINFSYFLSFFLYKFRFKLKFPYLVYKFKTVRETLRIQHLKVCCTIFNMFTIACANGNGWYRIFINALKQTMIYFWHFILINTMLPDFKNALINFKPGLLNKSGAAEWIEVKNYFKTILKLSLKCCWIS